jgi:hypothetical protein
VVSEHYLLAAVRQHIMIFDEQLQLE